MIFNPKKLTLKEGFFRIPEDATAQAHECLRCDIIKEFWRGFTFTTSELNISQTAGYSFALGDFEPLPLSGNDFSINVTERGIKKLFTDDGKCIYCDQQAKEK